MIVWISSYPKSGNTWVRGFIASLLYTNNGENNFSKLEKIKQFPTRKLFKNFVDNFQNINEVSKNWVNVQNFINLDNKIKFLKTHHTNCSIGKFNFTDDENTIGVIHIVRDPRNVITSIKNHFSLESINDAKNFILNDKNWAGIVRDNKDKDKDYKVPTLISSWKINYLSWKNRTQNYMLVKYEDLIKNPNKEFLKISNYISKIMNIKFSENKILNAIKTSSFENMKNLEEKGLFNESVSTKNDEKVKFFYLGPKNDWKIYLNNEIIEEINLKFKNEMEELGYL